MIKNYSKIAQQRICIGFLLVAFVMGGCSSSSDEKQSAWKPEEKKNINSVKIVRDLFDVVGCRRVGSLNVELEGDQREERMNHIRMEASKKGADTINEIRYYEGKAFSGKGLIVGEAYKCRRSI